ncbi:MAG: RNA polymerase sigma factor [Flavobacteriales bacterium]|nr:RNA polymerase sigma factor [Flavobacteriales bacterium]
MKDSKQELFMELYAPIHESFERFCRARVYGEMDYGDLMNETLLIAFKKFEDLRNKQAFLAYLFTIAVRVLSSSNRKKKTERFHTGTETTVIDPNARTDRDMEVEILHKALAQLPDAQRESLILFEINGFSIKEIAAIHEVRESSVKQRLRRGRIKLKELLMDRVEQETSVSNG